MYQFKGKSTNNLSVISEDLKWTPKIRFRYLYGTFNPDSQEATRSTSSIIWNGWGIGQSVFKYKAGISGYTIDLENTSIDLIKELPKMERFQLYEMATCQNDRF